MEFFRWILIITGIVLLGFAFMMGRQKSPGRVSRRANLAKRSDYDPSVDELSVPVDELSVPVADPLIEMPADSSTRDAGVSDESYAIEGEANNYLNDGRIDEPLDHYQSDFEPGYGDGYVQEQVAINNDFEEIDVALDDTDNSKPGKVTTFADAVKAANAQDDDFDQNIAEEFEPYSEAVQLDEFEEKLVSIHVVALSGRRFYGNDLKALFDKHGYSYGRMSLFHCTLDGEKVFSIANMVKPGTFDEDQMRAFETPGITLFMRLPIDLDSDVAFDFLIQEAKELAAELDGQLRDGNRNPLSEQTIQHLSLIHISEPTRPY